LAAALEEANAARAVAEADREKLRQELAEMKHRSEGGR
jgi:hypothetical protein